MMWLTWLLWLVFWTVLAIVVAKHTRRNEAVAGILGLLLGPIGILCVFLLSSEVEEEDALGAERRVALHVAIAKALSESRDHLIERKALSSEALVASVRRGLGKPGRGGIAFDWIMNGVRFAESVGVASREDRGWRRRRYVRGPRTEVVIEASELRYPLRLDADAELADRLRQVVGPFVPVSLVAGAATVYDEPGILVTSREGGPGWKLGTLPPDLARRVEAAGLELPADAFARITSPQTVEVSEPVVGQPRQRRDTRPPNRAV